MILSTLIWYIVKYFTYSRIINTIWRNLKLKSTGIVRKVDQLGRIVVPKELRRTLDVMEKDPLEIFVEDDLIILKKYIPDMTCQITGETSDTNLKLVNGSFIVSREAAEQLIKEIQTSLEH